MSICVVTDSTADIPPETREGLGIHVVPLKVIFGDEEFIDGVTMQAPERLYESSTAAPRAWASAWSCSTRHAPHEQAAILMLSRS